MNGKFRTVQHELFSKHYSKILVLLQEETPVLLYGCPGGGKSTFLQEWVQTRFTDLGEWTKDTYLINDRFSVELTTRQSPTHIEVFLCPCESHERHVMRLIQKWCSHMIINQKGGLCKKTVILYHTEVLSRESLGFLKVIMERYYKCSILLMTMGNISGVHHGMYGSMLTYRFTYPDYEQFYECILQSVGVVDETALHQVYDKERDIGRCLFRYYLKGEKLEFSYDTYIQDLLTAIHKGNHKQTRVIVYELIVNNIPSTRIIKDLVMFLLEDSIDQKDELVHYAAMYEHRLQHCERDIYHLEAFIYRLIYLLTISK